MYIFISAIVCPCSAGKEDRGRGRSRSPKEDSANDGVNFIQKPRSFFVQEVPGQQDLKAVYDAAAAAEWRFPEVRTRKSWKHGEGKRRGTTSKGKRERRGRQKERYCSLISPSFLCLFFALFKGKASICLSPSLPSSFPFCPYLSKGSGVKRGGSKHAMEWKEYPLLRRWGGKEEGEERVELLRFSFDPTSLRFRGKQKRASAPGLSRRRRALLIPPSLAICFFLYTPLPGLALYGTLLAILTPRFFSHSSLPPPPTHCLFSGLVFSVREGRGNSAALWLQILLPYDSSCVYP